MPVDEGFVVRIGTIQRMRVLSSLCEVANHHVLRPSCLVANPRISPLVSGTFKPFSKINMSCLVPNLVIESILVCVRHIVKLD